MTRESRAFAVRALIAVAAAVAGVLLLGLLWYAAQVFLVVFAGLLLAVGLAGLTDWIAAQARLRRGLALAAVTVGIAAIIGLGVWVLADDVAEQATELVDTLPRALDNVRDALGRTPAGRFVLERLPGAERASEQMADMAPEVVGATVGTTLGVATNLVVLLFIALYAAADPGLYSRGVTALLPRARRRRGAHVLETLGAMLRRWLLGKLVGMVIIGIVTWAGLALIGIPLALTLGLLAGLLNFVPYVGPLVSAVPAVLLALLQGTGSAGWVALLYLGLQGFEGYLLTPLIDQRTVRTPPALLLVSQVLAGVTLGALGVVLAAPLLAVGLVVVKLLYVEDVLGDDVEVPGEPPSATRAA